MIVGGAIGSRDKATAEDLWFSLPPDYRQCAVCFTDFYPVYASVLPSKRHKAVGKEPGKTAYIERFNNTLKLVITSPVHPLSYAAGVVAFSLLLGMFTGAAVLSFSPVVGIDIHLSWWLVPVLALTSLSLTGIGLIIATWVPSAEVGNVMANMAGIMVTMLSPVYFPIERLPHWLRWVVRFSPYTHAGAAVDGILSGRGGYGHEVVYLALITAAGLVVGVMGLRWREN